MSWTHIQSTSVQDGTGTTHTLAFTSPVTANSTLHITINNTNGVTVSSVVWSVGSSMAPVLVDKDESGNPCVYHYVARNASAGNHTVQVTLSGSQDCSIAVMEISSGNTGDTVRTQANARTATTTTPSLSSEASTPQVGDFVIISDGHPAGNVAVSAGSGYDLRQSITSNVNVTLAMETKEVGTAGTQSGGFTWASAVHGMAMTVLKPDNRPAPVPTRCYFPATTTPTGGITPGFAGWTSTASAVRRQLALTKGSSAATTGTTQNITSGSGNSTLDRQYISDGLAAGIVFDTAWTVKCQLLAQELATTDNVNLIDLCIKVVSSDGSTLQATLLALGNYGTTTELNTTLRNKTVADGDALTGTYTTVAGDRLVVEIGPAMNTTGTTPQAAIQYGETGTDLPVNETTTSGAGWIEFSEAITLDPGGAPAGHPTERRFGLSRHMGAPAEVGRRGTQLF